MKLLVLIAAVLIISLGISIIIHPEMLKEMLHRFLQKRWLWPVSIGRMVMGILFIMSANSTSMPLFVGIFGIALVIAGFSIPLLGSHRVESMASWWMAQKDYMIRMFGFVALLMGISLALSSI